MPQKLHMLLVTMTLVSTVDAHLITLQLKCIYYVVLFIKCGYSFAIQLLGYLVHAG